MLLPIAQDESPVKRPEDKGVSAAIGISSRAVRSAKRPVQITAGFKNYRDLQCDHLLTVSFAELSDVLVQVQVKRH